MTEKTVTTYFQAVDTGTKFKWGSIDPWFTKVDKESAVRVADDPKYIGKVYSFAPLCTVEYRPTMHICICDSEYKLCGAVSNWAANVFYAGNGSTFDDGDWCPKCMQKLQELRKLWGDNESRDPLSIGQQVRITNSYGVEIRDPHTITGIAPDGEYYLDTDAPWSSWKQRYLTPIE
jgi:hypothetical protein